MRILLVQPPPFEKGRLGLENMIWLLEPVALTAIAGAAPEHDVRNVASFGVMVQDRGRGSVGGALGAPWLRYDLDRRDARDLVEGMKFVATAFFRAGARRVMLPLAGLPNEFEAEEELRRIVPADVPLGAFDLAGFHPLGTVGLGTVTDLDQRLCERVWVSDGSVTPGPPGVNPQLTIAAFAHRLADRLLAG